MGAPAGNQNAARCRDSTLVVADVLSRYENQERSVRRGHALVHIIRGLVTQALDGDKHAAEIIFSRLWGKPKQQVDITGEGATELVALFQAAHLNVKSVSEKVTLFQQDHFYGDRVRRHRNGSAVTLNGNGRRHIPLCFTRKNNNNN